MKEGQRSLQPKSTFIDDNLTLLRKANEGILNISGVFSLRLDEQNAKEAIKNLSDHRTALMVRISSIRQDIEKSGTDEDEEYSIFLTDELEIYDSELKNVEDRLVRVCNNILYRQSNIQYSEEFKKSLKVIVVDVTGSGYKPSRIARPIKRAPVIAAPRASVELRNLNFLC
jgi:hypothetical protein